MDDLLAARSTMAFSLGFHIIFASVGMVMPFMMAVAHFLYLKKNRQEDLELTKLWMKGVAILFAVGAVSGTVLSFELGLLWPGFMKHAGPIIGMPFSWEGTAFFIEAIAIGLFLYGWNRMNRWAHWCAGLVVGISGFASGVFVVAANSWMNAPAGFEWVNGEAINIDPVAAMFNKAWLHQTMHMQVGAIQAVGFAVAGLHALLLLKGGTHSSLHKRALKIAMLFATVGSLIQPAVGHYAAQKVAEYQPAKLAAMEAHFKTEARASLIIGGIPDVETGEVHGAIKIPGALSFLAFNDVNATVKGLHDFPRDEWPPVLITHIAFQIMVGLGSLMIAVGLLYCWLARKGELPPWFLKVLLAMTPVGFIAIEAGWVVTEVGRQPWIVYGIMKTKDAVTPMPGVQFHFYLFVVLYLFLSFVTIWLFRRQVQIAEQNMNKGDRV